MTKYTPTWGISYPEGTQNVAVPKDVQDNAATTDAGLTDAKNVISTDVMAEVDERLAPVEPLLELMDQADPVEWDDAVYSAGVFDDDRASFLEVREDGTPTNFSATAISQALERIGWAGGSSTDLTQARAATFTAPPAGPVTDAVLATNQAGVAELVARIPTAYPGTDPVPIPESTSEAVRTPAGIALVIGTALATGTYNPDTAGMSEADATAQVVRLAMSVTATHLVNSEAPVWGTDLPPRNQHGSTPAQQNQWQSAYWAMNAAAAAWTVWPHLSVDQRAQTGAMIVHEADRMPGWTPPYWRDATGKVLRDGDSAAEDIGFQTTALALALAMYPAHSHAPAWMDTMLRQQLAAASVPQDIGSRALANGLVIGEVTTGGYNLTSDFEIENHSILPHPFYWGQVGANGATLGTWLAMSGLPVPTTLLHHAQDMWNTATTKVYESPPYNAPGGIVWPGNGTYYSPDGNDRSADMNQARIALMSMIADELNWQPVPFDLQQSAIASIQAQDGPLPANLMSAMGVAYRRTEYMWHLYSPAPNWSDQPVTYLLP